MTYDIGYRGKRKSLAGVESSEGRGLVLRSVSAACVAAAIEIVLPANGERVWALIQNTGTVNLQVFFTPDILTNSFIVLAPLGVLQLDDKIPWTGALYGYVAAGVTGEITATEASLL